MHRPRLTLTLAAALLLAGCGDEITRPAAPRSGPQAPDQPALSVLPDSKSATTAPGGPFNLRSGPGTSYDIVGSRDGNVAVTITCTSRGESVTGY